ncbi:hypothetical protein RN001_016231 [Aquatica leii]|uniref:TrmE-type G domain-containing protein n=1 Tax=Aquatica leii TaxID=1421715 RepID=A0AAN7PNY8_9COLE|nr:hypothetical protein RN001_016231 [Aquatica leii]
MKQSTIFAVSSGQGKCGVAVVRVSGADAGVALQQMTGLRSLPKPRRALLKCLQDPENGEVLDKGLVLWFPGPHSFTGEDICEFQVHGGLAVVASILRVLGTLPNLRLAAPGEFTRRAFYNGKLDLTEAEGLSDLLSAETELQRKQAFLQTEGYLSNVYKEWKQILIRSLANLEAFIDFHESEDIDEKVIDTTVELIAQLQESIKKHLSDGNRGERLRNGVKAVILGETNVGKSSLINILCKRSVAIVTPIHGTTRDVLEVPLDIGGYPLILADTAGMRSDTVDVIEQEGIDRALKAYQSADLILLVMDANNYLFWHEKNPAGSLYDFVLSYVQKLKLADFLGNDTNSNLTFKKQCIIIVNKIDLIAEKDLAVFASFQNVISCKSLYGFTTLISSLTNELKLLCSEPSKDHPSMNQMRHREHLSKCVKYLDSFLSAKDRLADDTDLMAEKLRRSLRQLDKLTGTFTTEQLLDVIFKEFCIGK